MGPSRRGERTEAWAPPNYFELRCRYSWPKSSFPMAAARTSSVVPPEYLDVTLARAWPTKSRIVKSGTPAFSARVTKVCLMLWNTKRVDTLSKSSRCSYMLSVKHVRNECG